MRRTLITLALAALALGACSSGDDSDTAAAGTTTTAEPTSTTTPEQGFLGTIEQRLTYDDPGTPQRALDMAQSMCQALDTATTGPLADDAANDSIGSDAGVSMATVEMGLSQVLATDLDDEVTAVIMTLGADYLCPQYSDAVTQFLQSQGL